MRRGTIFSFRPALAALAMALVPASAVLAEDASSAIPPGAPVTTRDISELQSLDDVVVTGHLNSLSGIRKALVESEDRFYARWNELNKDPAWDVQCETRAPTGTRIAVRSCDPAKVEEERHEEAMRLLGMGGNVRFTSIDEIRSQVNPELKAMMVRMVKSDPQLLLALVEHAKLVQIYEQTRRQKFAGHWFVND